MRNSSSPRLMKGLIVLSIACGLIGLLGWVFAIATGPSTESRSFAKANGMNVYSARGPFVIAVKSLSSPSDGFVFASLNQDLWVGDSPADQTDPKKDLRDVQLTLGDNYSISCLYRPALAGDVRELKLMLADYGLIDLNVDGQWDLRIHLPPKTRVEVVFQSKWREVTLEDGSEFRRKLIDGGYVLFDRSSGTWISDD